jgi:hypothetical protein
MAIEIWMLLLPLVRSGEAARELLVEKLILASTV